MSVWGAPKRSRSRKNLSASFSKLSRIVSEIKSKRKSLAAHHNLVVELMASPPFTGFPLFPVSSSVSPSQNPKLSATLNLSPSAPPSLTPQHPKLPATLPRAVPQSAMPTSAKSGNSLKLSAIIPAQVSGSSPTQVSGGISSQIFEADSMENTAHMAPFPSTYPGKQAAKPTFWAVLFLAFLCTFLCTGKEIAVIITIAAYLIILLRSRLGFVAKQKTTQSISNPVPSYPVQEYRSMFRPLNRSSTIPANRGCTFSSSSPSVQLTTRSKSLPIFHGSLQELQSSEPGRSVDSASRVCLGISSSQRIEGKDSARLKLQMMLLMVLCGLVHGRIMAVFMASCCIVIFSKMQRLV